MAREKELSKIKYRTDLFQCYRNTLILGTLLMTDPFIHATAQEFQAALSFNRDTVPVTNGTMVPLTLKIQDHAASAQNDFVEISTGSVLELFSRNRICPLPDQGKSLYVPVSIRVPERTASGKLYPVKATLNSRNGNILEQAVCYLKVIPSRKVILSLPQSAIMLSDDDHETDIPIQLTNKGNTPQTVSVIVQFPSLQQWQDILKIALPPFSDTIIHFNKRARHSFYHKNLQQIHITGVYANGDPLGRVSASISARSSTRDYRQLFAQENEQSAYNGRITLTGQYLFTPAETWNLSANGNILFRSGVLDYQLDITRWKNVNTHPLLVRNTYLTYEHLPTRLTAKRWSITAGNLSRNYEQTVSGRGVSIFLADSTGINRIEAGIAQGIYSLFSPFDTGQSWCPATSLWVSFQHLKNNIRWNSSLLQQTAPYGQRVSRIWSNEFNYLFSKGNTVTITANAGNSKTTSGASRNRAGMAGGLAFDGNSGHFSLNSSNFFSTAYYPGMRQGALNMQQRLSHTMGKHGRLRLWTTFNRYQYNPKQLPGTETGFTRRYGSTRAASGLSFQKNNLFLSFLPEWNREKSNSLTLYAPDMPSVLRAWDLNTTVSYSGFPSHRQFSVSSSIGFLGNTSDTGIEPLHFRSRLNWRFQSFSLMASWQSGYFYLGEMASGISGMPGKTYHHLFISPQWTGRFCHNRGMINTSLSWTRGNKVGSNLMFNLGIRFNLNSRTEVFSNFTRYEYSSGNQAMNDLQTGVSSVLPPSKFSGKNYTLEVFLYKDLNRNGIWDKDDPPAGQLALSVGGVRFQQSLFSPGKTRTGSALHLLNQNVPFVTDAAGLIRYRGMPAGDYLITIAPDKGWYAEKREVTLNRSTRMEIPLQQAGVLKGGITLTDNGSGTNGLIAEQMSKHGIQVIAVSPDGKTYTAQTDEKGNFVFYLPAGSYTAELQLSSSECLCLNNNQAVQVDPAQPVLLYFKVTFKQKKIEIKRFRDASVL